MFGREARLPIDVMFGNLPEPVKDLTEYAVASFPGLPIFPKNSWRPVHCRWLCMVTFPGRAAREDTKVPPALEGPLRGC